MASRILGLGKRAPIISNVITFCPDAGESNKTEQEDDVITAAQINAIISDSGIDIGKGTIGKVAAEALSGITPQDDLMTSYDVIGGCVYTYYDALRDGKVGIDDFSRKYFTALSTNHQLQLGPYDALSQLFAAPVFKNYRYREIVEYDNKRAGPPKIGGGEPCRKCKSVNTYSMTIQARAADEPSDTIVICIDCGARSKSS